MTSRRRSSDIVLTLCVCWVTGTVNSQEIVLRIKVFGIWASTYDFVFYDCQTTKAQMRRLARALLLVYTKYGCR